MNITRRAWIAGVPGLLWSATPAIHSEHPRLFFRRQAWGRRGLTLAEVRRRGARFADTLVAGSMRSPEGAPNFAMHYVLTGSEDSAREAVRLIQIGHGKGEWTTTQGDEIEASAVAYDWLAGAWPGFPQDARVNLQEQIAAAGLAAMRALRTGASIYHTRMYAWANAALFAGIALHGEHPEAAGLADFGIRYYRERLMPARAHIDGAWFNAMSYGRKYMCRSVFSFLTAWRSATGEDLWAEARKAGNNWPETMLFYLLYMLRPDHRYGVYGDIFDSMWSSDRGTRRLVAQAVHETRNPYGQGFLQELEQHHGSKTYDRESRWYQIFEDPSIPAKPRSGLPRSRLFSRNALGAAVMRSGWGPHDTWVFFKCGDYGDNHGHFDQGHFEIFRGGQLALDSFYGAKETLYHNTILVNDPKDPADRGNQRSFSRQNHSSLEAYLADPVVRTGRILDYRDDARATSVLGDATAAYPREKVKQFTRQVVFLDGTALVIFDVVEVAEASLRRRFLLHHPGGAVVEGQSFRWVNNGGQLTGRVLLPERAAIVNRALTQADRPMPYRGFAAWYPQGRLEVEPAGGDSPLTHFLHVLFIEDEGKPVPEARLLEGEAIRVRIGRTELAFDKSGTRLCTIRSLWSRLS